MCGEVSCCHNDNVESIRYTEREVNFDLGTVQNKPDVKLRWKVQVC